MVYLKIKTKIRPDKMVEFEQAVDYILQSDKNNPGCQSKGVYRDLKCYNDLLYIEEWKNIDGLKSHIGTDPFKSILGAMKVLGEISESRIITSAEVQLLEDNIE